MAAVAHVSPAQFRSLSIVPTSTGTSAVYRRRRAVAGLVVVAMVTALVLALGGLFASFGGGAVTTAERPGAAASVYVVQPGDTFWDIARRLQPGEDPRPLVARLVAAHGSPVLVPGERLTLPAPA
jgi:nucleoid-associated protein YgaU